MKSAALLWALDERPEVRAAVRAAHEAARDAALQMLEERRRDRRQRHRPVRTGPPRLIEAGQVEKDGVQLRDGNHAGTGDWIVTRHNDRRLPVRGGRDWVKNGDAWHITQRHQDGSLTATHMDHGGRIRLPADYVRRHVELLYATTTNRAQGTTVDTAHPLITADMGRENLYVIATRARERTTLYVTTHELLAYDPDERLDRVKNDARMYAAREVLENILARENNERSANETIRDAQQQATSLATLVPRYTHAADLLAATQYKNLTQQTFGTRLAEQLTSDPAWPAVAAALGRAEATGWQPERLLAATLRQDELSKADSAAQLLTWRIAAYVKDRIAPPPLHRPTTDDVVRYVRLLQPKLTDQAAIPDTDSATVSPAALVAPPRESAARPASPHVRAATLARYAAATAVALEINRGTVTRHRAWPHLAAALAAADRSGVDLADLLTRLTEQSPGAENEHSVDQISQLARTTRRLLHSHGVPSGDIAVPRSLRHTQTVAAALGIQSAERARQESAWPALDAALRRAERGGHHPIRLLTQVAEARELDTADSLRRPRRQARTSLRRLLPGPPVRALASDPGPAVIQRAKSQTDEILRALAWTLKAIENSGTPAETVLDQSGSSTISETLQHVRQAAIRIRSGPASEQLLPPWITNPPVVS